MKKEILETIMNHVNKELEEKEKKEVYERTIELFEKGMNGVFVATNKGNIIVGSKVAIIGIVGTALQKLYDSNDLTKLDLKAMFDTILETSEKNDEKDDINKLLDEFSKLFD